jgi:hypothetical protein
MMERAVVLAEGLKVTLADPAHRARRPSSRSRRGAGNRPWLPRRG